MSGARGPSRGFRLVLTAAGGLFVASALVNLVSAWLLVEPADEQAVGLSRTELVGTYGAMLAAGAVLIWFGLRRK